MELCCDLQDSDFKEESYIFSISNEKMDILTKRVTSQNFPEYLMSIMGRK